MNKHEEKGTWQMDGIERSVWKNMGQETNWKRSITLIKREGERERNDNWRKDGCSMSKSDDISNFDDIILVHTISTYSFLVIYDICADLHIFTLNGSSSIIYGFKSNHSQLLILLASTEELNSSYEIHTIIYWLFNIFQIWWAFNANCFFK